MLFESIFWCFVLSLHNSQSSSLIWMKAMLGSPFLAFQLLEISGPKFISAMKSSSNSSTLSSTMVKFANTDLLAGVKTKSLIVFTTSVRPDSTLKGANKLHECGLIMQSIPKDLTCHLSIAKNPVSKIPCVNSSLNGGIKGKA